MTAESTKRRQTVALFLSGVFPGLGQFYNRQPVKGGFFFGSSAVLAWLFAQAAPADPLALLQAPPMTVVLTSFAFLAVSLWSVADAWRAAGRSPS